MAITSKITSPSGPWRCPNCGYENSAYDLECFSCKHSWPGNTPSHSSTGHKAASRDHMTVVHYIVMAFLLAGTILFCLLTPVGKRLIGNIHVGLVMEFSTITFQQIFDSWTTVLIIMALIGAGIGLFSGEGGGAAFGGALVGVLAYLAVCAIWTGLVNYVFPFILNTGAIVLVVAVCLAFALGCSVAIVNYGRYFVLYLNPYPKTVGVYDDGERLYYEDKHKNREEYGKRSYFFGPGLFSIKQTVKNSWKANFKLIGNVVTWLKFHTDSVWEWLCWIPGVPFLIFYSISILIVGSIVTIVCSLLHAIPILVVMLIINILFSITWLVDRIYLSIHSIKSSCPYDQTRSVIPAFKCPDCGNMHLHLVPGPYGIWHRRCTCGKVLPTTFLMGRSKLQAYCPQCGHELAASDVQQFSLTIVGGTSSGKTVLISAFYHKFLELLKKNTKVNYEIPAIHKDMFDDLESWYSGAQCAATAANVTSDMYSILFSSDSLGTDKQFSIYDIAGEAFDDPTMASMLPQKQMRDSNGIVIVIDPLSSTEMLNEAKSEGEDTNNHADGDAASVISNFIVYLRTVVSNGKLRNRSDKPVAVVISKADIPTISKKLSYYSIMTHMNKNPGEFASFNEARDTLSRDFLLNNGLRDVVNTIEAGFSNVHYFPVSAMGHRDNGEEYEPEHVVEPFYWLINTTAPEIGALLGIDE